MLAYAERKGSMSETDPVVLAEVIRGEMVESRHRGSIVALGSDGEVAFAAGSIDVPMYPRSASKPAQATAMARVGLDLNGELLALAASSHSGEGFHVEGARSILAKFGLSESDLQNTPKWPLDEDASRRCAGNGNAKSSIVADCSGKHAAMLATCVVNDWPLDNYLDSGHRLQQTLNHEIAELAGESVDHTAVDGCGAPLFAVSLTGVARMFQTLATADRSSAGGRVAAAIRDFPEWVSGTTRFEARLIRAVPGLICKVGAEGVYAAALNDGRAVALKIEDGAVRPLPVVMEAALGKLGVDVPTLSDLGADPDTERIAAIRAADFGRGSKGPN
jgi:L-asparaginase II